MNVQAGYDVRKNTVPFTGQDGREYKVYNGCWYNAETTDLVIEALDNAYRSDLRIRVDFGNTETGESWNEEYDTTGYVGRSCGNIHIPLLVHNARSMGGGALLSNFIVGIYAANKKNGTQPMYLWAWDHPSE